jgi:hypothetical protein
MLAEKFHELVEEFRGVVWGQSNLVDAILPPLIFVLLNALLGLGYAAWGAFAGVLLIAGLRLVRGQSLRYALGGLGGVTLALVVARLLGRAEGYFIPGILTGAGTILVALASLIIRRPMVAWTSYIARRWPLDWYWHPRVRPAYSEVTWLWMGFFTLRSLLQIAVLRNASVEALAITNLVTGWPATVALLVISYLYGTWRLRNLCGPSVEEFKADTEPPWKGQHRGF